jgi:hypothetical protein
VTATRQVNFRLGLSDHEALTIAAFLRDTTPPDLCKTLVLEYLAGVESDPAFVAAAEARQSYRARESGDVVALRRQDVKPE